MEKLLEILSNALMVRNEPMEQHVSGTFVNGAFYNFRCEPATEEVRRIFKKELQKSICEKLSKSTVGDIIEYRYTIERKSGTIQLEFEERVNDNLSKVLGKLPKPEKGCYILPNETNFDFEMENENTFAMCLSFWLRKKYMRYNR